MNAQQMPLVKWSDEEMDSNVGRLLAMHGRIDTLKARKADTLAEINDELRDLREEIGDLTAQIQEQRAARPAGPVRED